LNNRDGIIGSARSDYYDSASMSSATTSPATSPSWQNKRVDEMTSEERLASLQAWAEEKKYVQPGEGGTLAIGVGGVNSLAWGGPLRNVEAMRPSDDPWQGQYDSPVGPPSYRVATSEEPEKRPSVLRRWLEKRKHKKEAKRSATVSSNVVRIER
jgi:hypothetical protein